MTFWWRGELDEELVLQRCLQERSERATSKQFTPQMISQGDVSP